MQKKFCWIGGLVVCTVAIVTVYNLAVQPLHYCVEIENKGKEMISVDPFKICDGRFSIVEVGDVYSNGLASISPFCSRPFHKLIINWRSSVTRKRGKAEVTLNLPKQFTKERGFSIVFEIFPEDQKVDVAYGIKDPASGQVMELYTPTIAPLVPMKN